jgi:hypothetical protein
LIAYLWRWIAGESVEEGEQQPAGVMPKSGRDDPASSRLLHGNRRILSSFHPFIRELLTSRQSGWDGLVQPLSYMQ